MKTLYDLLGALPDDDAEELRSAFRKAVKGTHPDINPGDPDAALRFRQIVRANDILSDEEQRAAYDHLLELARQEQEQEQKRAVAAKVHKVASNVMAIAGAAATAVGGYLVFMHVSAASIAPLKPIVVMIDRIRISPVATRPIELAAVTPAPIAVSATDAAAVETVASLPDRSALPVAAAQADAANEAGDTNASGTTNVPAGVAASGAASAPGAAGAPGAANAPGAAGAPGINDAKFYRDRGMAAYRKGDLVAAIADLDQAVQIDPKFAGAYADRSIIFYRMRKFDRAFADVATAKRIEKANRAVMDAMAGKLPLHPLKLDPPKLTRVSQRRTSVPD
jgi:tetratricopeptide (TPR) repeat protein